MRIMRQWDGRFRYHGSCNRSGSGRRCVRDLYGCRRCVYRRSTKLFLLRGKLKEISYDEMQELASMGANVLHNRSVEMAEKNMEYSWLYVPA